MASVRSSIFSDLLCFVFAFFCFISVYLAPFSSIHLFSMVYNTLFFCFVVHLFIQLISVSISNTLDALQFFLDIPYPFVPLYSLLCSSFLLWIYAVFFTFLFYSFALHHFCASNRFSSVWTVRGYACVCLALQKSFEIVFLTSIFVFNTVWKRAAIKIMLT